MSAERPQDSNSPGSDYAQIVKETVRWTHRIREEKAIGLIYEHYSHNVPVHQTGAESYGRDQVVENTIRTLAAFPDLRLYGDEVIWNDRETGGVFCSHRVNSTGRHLGHGIYGPPTGERVRYREITQRLVRQGRVVEEWIVRDETALLRQLGIDEVGLARTLSHHEAAHGMTPWADSLGEVSRSHGQRPPPTRLEGDPRHPGELPAHLYGLTWNARMLNTAADYYAPGAAIWVPGNRRLAGPDNLIHYVLQLLAAFPDGAMQLEHVTQMGTKTQGDQLAARWMFQGTHTGPGIYGPPTGKRVRLMGISHFQVRRGRIEREYMVWNEFALLKQLHRPA